MGGVHASLVVVLFSPPLALFFNILFKNLASNFFSCLLIFGVAKKKIIFMANF